MEYSFVKLGISASGSRKKQRLALRREREKSWEVLRGAAGNPRLEIQQQMRLEDIRVADEALSAQEMKHHVFMERFSIYRKQQERQRASLNLMSKNTLLPNLSIGLGLVFPLFILLADIVARLLPDAVRTAMVNSPVGILGFILLPISLAALVLGLLSLRFTVSATRRKVVGILLGYFSSVASLFLLLNQLGRARMV